MFFSAFLGSSVRAAEWRELMQEHAAWLGLIPSLHHREAENGHILGFGWLRNAGQPEPAPLGETRESILLSTLGSRSPHAPHSGDRHARGDSSHEEMTGNDILVRIRPRPAAVRVAVPPAAVEQLYYGRDERGHLLGNDLRLLMRWMGDEYEPEALYALMWYGAVPPTLTFARKVHRVPTGHKLEIASVGSEPSLTCWYRPSLRKNAEDEPRSESLAALLKSLDVLLEASPRSTILFFSGGVDSGLLAARLHTLGRSDIELVNLRFGDRDPESELADRMAAHLGLKCRHVLFDLKRLSEVLSSIGEDYSFPFADLSVIPTNLLVRDALGQGRRGATVLEGTGADGAFGIGTKYPFWRRFYEVPRAGRWFASRVYRGLGLWRRDATSRLERVGRVAARSLRMPLAHAALVATNSLDGIAYDLPEETARSLEEAVRTRMETLSSGLPPQDRFSYLDMVHVCAGIYAAKSFDPLRRRGVRAIYPFLEPAILNVSFSIAWSDKCPGGEPKWILKNELAKHVPREMVFRPKSGFLPPFRRILASSPMQDFLRGELLSASNPFRGVFREKVVGRMLDRGARALPLSQGAYNLMWGLAFASRWYRQSRNRST